MYIRSRFRQLYLIIQEFSTELCPLIYVKSVFPQCLQNGWNFMKVMYTSMLNFSWRGIMYACSAFFSSFDQLAGGKQL